MVSGVDDETDLYVYRFRGAVLSVPRACGVAHCF